MPSWQDPEEESFLATYIDWFGEHLLLSVLTIAGLIGSLIAFNNGTLDGLWVAIQPVVIIGTLVLSVAFFEGAVPLWLVLSSDKRRTALEIAALIVMGALAIFYSTWTLLLSSVLVCGYCLYRENASSLHQRY